MIKIKNLTKKYGETLIFEDLSFDFPDQGLVCIFGASGCGKSTLLNMIAGFDSDYNGDITVFGTSINDMNADALCSYRRNNIGFVFQNYHLLSGYTVNENVLLSAELNAMEKAESEVVANKLLEKLGMSEKSNEKAENLSGGQKQRVAIARALINNPPVILADEPTGALDRNNSNEIMNLLKQAAKDRLVIVITHDPKCAEYADFIVNFENRLLITDQIFPPSRSLVEQKESPLPKVSSLKQGFKNFKVHFLRYISVSLAISIGILCFILSLSSDNIINKSIEEFQEKNTAFHNGYIKADGKGTEILDVLSRDKRIENLYEQYVLQNISITLDGKKESMAEKYPMPKAIEKMSYGVMPKAEKKEIALSPSLAAKFSVDIKSLLGKEIILEFKNKEYNLTVCGIFNAGYDDFFVSSDIEKQLYKNSEGNEAYSISYDVTEFDEIVAVSELIKNQGYESKNASVEVGAFQNTFQNLSRLFLAISILVLSIGVFISSILLIKLQNSRIREIGLLSALGYTKGIIRRMIVSENLLLAMMAVLFNGILVTFTIVISNALSLELMLTMLQFLQSVCLTAVIIIVISILSSIRLISTEPAWALRQS